MFDISGEIKILPIWAVNDCSRVKKMFEANKKNLNVEYDFEQLLEFTHLYVTFKNNKISGAVYFFNDPELQCELFNKFDIKKGDGGPLLFMNGFSSRKMLKENIFFIHQAAKYYNTDIYAYTDKKSAVYYLLFSGFEEISAKNANILVDKFRLFKLTKKCS